MSKYSEEMNQFEEERHSFVIRIWLERDNAMDSGDDWRGWIDHLPSGARRYFREFSEISDFMVACTSEGYDRPSRPDKG